ncbi:hypothetical protein ACFL0U_03050 [Pseudomonadota bacterium]
MFEIFGAITGFIGAVIPNILKLLQDKFDRKHELEIMKLQIKSQKEFGTHKIEEINVNADIPEKQSLYKTFYSGIKWIDVFNGSVRPTLAYAFFLLYTYTKIAYFLTAGDNFLISEMWTTVDNTIFMTIISFFYGQRAMQKIME